MSINAPHLESNPSPDNLLQPERQFEIAIDLLSSNSQQTLEPGANQTVPSEVLSATELLTYTTESGKRYSAENAQRAIEVGCSYLGSVSLRQANILFNLEAKGRAKMAEQAEPQIPKLITENHRKLQEVVKGSTKEQLPQKAQVLAVEHPLRSPLTKPERVEVTPFERLDVVEPKIIPLERTVIEQARISDLSNAIALSRINLLQTKDFAKLAGLDAITEIPLVLAAPQHPESTAAGQQANINKVFQFPGQHDELSFKRLDSVSLDQPESLERSVPVAGRAMPVAEMFATVESDEKYRSEANLPLSLNSLFEGIVYDVVAELETGDESIQSVTINESPGTEGSVNDNNNVMAGEYESTETQLAYGELPIPSSAEESLAVLPVNHEKTINESISLLRTILSESVHKRLETYVESAEPVQAAKIDSLRELISETISHLQKLEVSEVAEPQKIEILKQLLKERHRELLQALDVAIDEGAFELSVLQLEEVMVQISGEEDQRAGLDEGTHEHKQNFGSIANDFSGAITQKLQHMKLAKFVVRASMTPASI